MRIAIVNDLLIEIEALRRVINTVVDYQIAWVAFDGAEAVEKCRADTPDIILMNVIMPVMDGVQATKIIMQQCPCAIMMITSSVSGNATRVFDALSYGALDVSSAPVYGKDGKIKGADEFLKKIVTISKLLGKKDNYVKNIPESTTFPVVYPKLIAIGSSTGGPKALSTIISKLPQRLDSSIVIVQHVDVQFADGLAEWLGAQTKMKVQIAVQGKRPEINNIYIAGTNDHLVLDKYNNFDYTPEPQDYPYRPSVDVFFESLSATAKSKGMAILLTGMGSDGAKGLLSLKNAGWQTIAQDEKTSVVYGMPKAAKEIGAANYILPLEQISDAISNFVSGDTNQKENQIKFVNLKKKNLI